MPLLSRTLSLLLLLTFVTCASQKPLATAPPPAAIQVFTLKPRFSDGKFPDAPEAVREMGTLLFGEAMRSSLGFDDEHVALFKYDLEGNVAIRVLYSAVDTTLTVNTRQEDGSYDTTVESMTMLYDTAVLRPTLERIAEDSVLVIDRTATLDVFGTPTYPITMADDDGIMRFYTAAAMPLPPHDLADVVKFTFGFYLQGEMIHDGDTLYLEPVAHEVVTDRGWFGLQEEKE